MTKQILRPPSAPVTVQKSLTGLANLRPSPNGAGQGAGGEKPTTVTPTSAPPPKK